MYLSDNCVGSFVLMLIQSYPLFNVVALTNPVICFVVSFFTFTVKGKHVEHFVWLNEFSEVNRFTHNEIKWIQLLIRLYLLLYRDEKIAFKELMIFIQAEAVVKS